MTQQEQIDAAKAAGLDCWIEQGVVKTCVPVDPIRFGPHSYFDPDRLGNLGLKFEFGNCTYGCGCSMAQSSSKGPVHPFGMCPKNPK